MAKKNRAPIPKSITDPNDLKIGELVSGDIIGPIDPPSRDGTKYFFLFVDRRTSYYHAHTSRTKDGFITTLKLVYEDYASHGHKMLSFRSDSEQIMVVGDVAAFLASNGVDQQWSLPYQHHQNLVERHVQTISKAISTMMLEQNLLGSSFCEYALHYMSSGKVTDRWD